MRSGKHRQHLACRIELLPLRIGARHVANDCPQRPPPGFMDKRQVAGERQPFAVNGDDEGESVSIEDLRNALGIVLGKEVRNVHI